MKCANCGAEIKLGCVYCSVCGKEAQIVPDYNVEEDILKEKSTDSFLKIPTFEEFLAMRKKKAAEEKESRQEGIDNDGE